MKRLIKPAVYGIMAALGIVLIAVGMETKPTFTWPQVALVVGGLLVFMAMSAPAKDQKTAPAKRLARSLELNQPVIRSVLFRMDKGRFMKTDNRSSRFGFPGGEAGKRAFVHGVHFLPVSAKGSEILKKIIYHIRWKKASRIHEKKKLRRMEDSEKDAGIGKPFFLFSVFGRIVRMRCTDIP